MAMTALSSTLVDLVIFITNLYSFNRLEARIADGQDVLMSAFFVHKILNRALVWFCDYLGVPPLPRGQWELRPGDEPRGYESPDYDQPYVREPPQRANSSRTDFPDPHLLNHAAADSTERGEPASNASLNDHELVSKERDARSVGIRDRIACFRWSWFTMTMATGGIANIFSAIPVPYQARWVTVIGLIFFFLNLGLFVINCILISLRFRYRPHSFRRSVTDQVESLFTPAIIVSIATIFMTVCEYGIPHAGPWLLRVMQVLFWMYLGLSVIFSSGLYLILWSTLAFPIHTMTPIWVFPAYPLLMTAPFGSILLAGAVSTGRLGYLNPVAISFACIAVQGGALLISLMISTAFIYRLMTQKLPRDAQRPGIFVSIGPFGFTVAGLVGLANNAEYIVPDDILGNVNAVSILKILSYMVGLWLWALSLWFFIVSVGSLWKYFKPSRRLPFHITWFSFVFPNTALVTATFSLGTAFKSDGLKIFGCVLVAALVVVWLMVLTCGIRSLRNRKLLWPKDDD